MIAAAISLCLISTDITTTESTTELLVHFAPCPTVEVIKFSPPKVYPPLKDCNANKKLKGCDYP